MTFSFFGTPKSIINWSQSLNIAISDESRSRNSRRDWEGQLPFSFSNCWYLQRFQAFNKCLTKFDIMESKNGKEIEYLSIALKLVNKCMTGKWFLVTLFSTYFPVWLEKFHLKSVLIKIYDELYFWDCQSSQLTYRFKQNLNKNN